MLYHVPDLPRSLAEIRRVLKPGGQLIAATNGTGHMRELNSLAGEFDVQRSLTPDLPFTLESGGAQLQPFFSSATRHDFVDSLAVTETEPLVAYILSMRMAFDFFTPERIAKLRVLIDERIARDGVFHIGKSSGIFVCIRDRNYCCLTKRRVGKIEPTAFLTRAAPHRSNVNITT